MSRVLGAVAVTAAAVAVALSVAVARAQPEVIETPFSNGLVQSSSPPLPTGLDPAMAPSRPAMRGRGSADGPNHPIDHQPEPAPAPDDDDDDTDDDDTDDNDDIDSNDGAPMLVPGLVDLMHDGCFAPSTAIDDYNEYGFRKLPAGSSLGAWLVTAGDVDEYYAPAVDASPAAHGGSSTGASAAGAAAANAGGAPDDDEGADADADGDGTGADGGDDSELSWLLPRGSPSGCQSVLDINGERPATISQTFETVPGGAYRLEFSFAGDALPHNLGPPPHKVPTFKSLSVFWDGRKAGDVFINAMDKANVGMDWDRASFLLNATSHAASLVVLSTTKGRSGLAVTDFRLWNVTGIANGGVLIPPAARSHHKAVDEHQHQQQQDPDLSGPTQQQRQHGHGGGGSSGVGVLLSLFSIVVLVSLGAVMVLGARSSSYLPSLSLPFFLRGAEEGYGVLGASGMGGMGSGGGMSGGGGGYQSAYQQGAVELAAARGWNDAAAGARRGDDDGVDSEDDDDDEVMFTRRRGEEKGESKREGALGASAAAAQGGGHHKGRKGRRKEGV